MAFLAHTQVRIGMRCRNVRKSETLKAGERTKSQTAKWNPTIKTFRYHALETRKHLWRSVFDSDNDSRTTNRCIPSTPVSWVDFMCYLKHVLLRSLLSTRATLLLRQLGLLFKASSRRWCLEPKAICGESSCHKKASMWKTEARRAKLLQERNMKQINPKRQNKSIRKKVKKLKKVWKSDATKASSQSLGPKTLSSRSKSRILVAPSASAMSKSCPGKTTHQRCNFYVWMALPRAASMPVRTANPLPPGEEDSTISTSQNIRSMAELSMS